MSDVGEGGLFGPIEARGLADEALRDDAFVRAMMRAESALATVEAEAGLIASDHAAAIAEACRGPAPDPDALGLGARATGAPVVPLLDALRDRLDPAAAASLHHGATSQDIVDTATMLVAAGAVRMILLDLEATARAMASLVEDHASTPMAGRTLLQHARPTTFGARAGGWLAGLDAAIDSLARMRDERLAVQLGGPAGTLEDLGPDPQRLVEAYAARLGLVAPGAPWHAERGRIAELAGALGAASASVAKPALDLVLLAQAEVGEVTDTDPERGGSSSMAHKRNPVAAVLARASAMRAPGLVANLVAAAGAGEHERAAGAWHAEWRSLRELLRSVGSAAAWLRDAVEHVAVDDARMERNLAITGDLGDRGPAVEAAGRVARHALDAHARRIGLDRRRGVRLHRTVDGPVDAPVVVLGNSLGSTLAMWDGVVPALSEQYRVVRYDLRGHGGSPTPPGPYAMEDLGADLLTLLDDLGVERAHLVGTSIGGMAALWVAAHAPDRVDRLVAIGTSARLGPASGWIERSRTVLAQGTGAVAAAVVARWVTPGFAAANPAVMARYVAMFDDADPTGYAGCCLAIAGMDQTDALAAIRAPTMVVVGTEDAATPREHADAIVERVPNVRLATMAGAGHIPSLEHPHEVARLVAEHLG